MISNIIKKIPDFIKLFIKYLFLYVALTLMISALSFLVLDKLLGTLFNQLPGDLGRAVESMISWLFLLLFVSMEVANDAEKDARNNNYNIITFANIFAVVTIIMIIPLNYFKDVVDMMGHPFSYIYSPSMWLYIFMQKTVFVTNVIVLLLNVAVFLFVYHRAYNSSK